ncbi:MAG: glycoside hydrolase family 95 protein [Bacteroidales bacterium]|nr:glycoside hydrolase family 95 protein [Bacteroidales bacterium]
MKNPPSVSSTGLFALVLLLASIFSPALAGNLLLRYDRDARFFEESLVIGNGRMGAAVYGSAHADRLSLNDITLWTGEPVADSATDYSGCLQRVRTLLDADDYERAEEANMMLQGPYSENYQPLGNLYIHYGSPDNDATAIERTLNIGNAIASTRAAGCKREYFASSPDSVIVIRVSNTGKNASGDIVIQYDTPLPHSTVAADNMLITDGYAAFHSFPVYYHAVPDSLKHQYDPTRGIHFRTIVAVKPHKGRVVAKQGKLLVKGGSKATIYVVNETSFNGFDRDPVASGKDYKALASRRIAKVMKKHFEQLRNDHIADYQRLFNRVSLNLGSTAPEIKALPTDVQLRLYTEQHQSNPELEALYFQFGRYLLIACSRTEGVPANLQGLWNESMLPPWSCNYTTNINMEENYWLAESTNLSELHTPLLSFISRLAVNGAATARSLYGIERGWCLGHNSDIWARTSPVGLQKGGPLWASWNMGGAWVASHIFEHYAFTLDKDFLAEYYPCLKGAAEFCIDWLVEKEGFLMTSPGTSPENQFVLRPGVNIATSYGTTSDLAMIRQCLIDASCAAKALNRDSDFIAEVSNVLARLAPYKTGSKGSLQEWWRDWDESDKFHRHQSHLYGLYPGNHINVDSMPDLARACHRTLELRGPESTGWSTGWRVNLYARLKDNAMAYSTFRRLLKYISPDGYRGDDAVRGGGTYPNLLDAHSPFQIDGNFGGSAGVAEMLLQSTPHSITLLPALPKEWASGSVSGLCARGGFTLDFAWQSGRVTSVTISSVRGGSTSLFFNGSSVQVHLQPNQSLSL